jgi:uncharacterized spore protein YtfJ
LPESLEEVEMSLERLFEVVEGLRQTAMADAAFGDPQEVAGRVLIPVSSVMTGFGLGFGRGMPEQEPEQESEVPWDMEQAPEGEDQEAAEGGGGGGGAGSHPVAVIEVTPETTIVRPILDETKIAIAGILLAGWFVFWLFTTVRAVFGRRSRGR